VVPSAAFTIRPPGSNKVPPHWSSGTQVRGVDWRIEVGEGASFALEQTTVQISGALTIVLAQGASLRIEDSRLEAGSIRVKPIVLTAAAAMIGAATILTDPIFYTPVPVHRLGSFIYDSTLALFFRLALAMGGLALLHYIFQLKKTEKDLMMTKQEIKDENRQAMGDPNVKMAQRAMARRLMQKQMLADVPNADVIITNPTHYAVALKYERGVDAAPVVLAKGQNLFAQRIKALASKHEVPTVENKPVARALYKFGQVGKPIPAQLYQAIAEILGYVYRTHRYYFYQLKSRRLKS
jgi:flagellar biosynthetic protein FlhB